MSDASKVFVLMSLAILAIILLTAPRTPKAEMPLRADDDVATSQTDESMVSPPNMANVPVMNAMAVMMPVAGAAETVN